jgi:hypothetical protein
MIEESIEKKIPDSYLMHNKLPVNEACTHGFTEYYYPKNSLDTKVIEFQVEGNGDHCIDPKQIFLKLEFNITGKAVRGTANGTTATEVAIDTGKDSAKVYAINNIFHSSIESVEVYVGNEATTKVDRNYPYCAYLDTIKSYGEHKLHTYCQLAGFYKDDASNMDATDADASKPLQHRAKFWRVQNNTLKGEFIGRLCSPLFQQDRVLPSQVPLRVVLRMASNQFVLMHEPGNFELKVTGAVLMVQKVTLSPGLKESWTKLMEEDHPLQYYLETPTVNYYTLEANSTQFMRDDLFMGKTPKHIILAMVETKAYQGDPTKNPFNFRHFNVSEVALYKDGMPYPCPNIKTDFQNNVFKEAYHMFSKSLGAAYSSFALPINMDEYAHGYTLFSYDMSPDQSQTIVPATMMGLNSNIRLEMKFSAPLPENVTLIVYAKFENLMEISKGRGVRVVF